MFVFFVRVWWWGVLLLGGAAAWAGAIPADSTQWVENNDTPWMHEIQRLPDSHERPLAYWRARAPAHPGPTIADLTLLDRLAEATAVRDVAASYPLRLTVLRLARQQPDPQVLAEMLLHMADYHAQLTDHDSVAYYLTAAERAFRRGRHLGGVLRCLLRLGRVAGQQGRYGAGLAYYERVLALATVKGTGRYHTDAQIELGALYAQVGDAAVSRDYLLAAQRDAARHDYPDRMNRALGELGELYRQQRLWGPARQYLTRSVAISYNIKEVAYALAKQLSLARLREDQGQYAAAAAEGRQVLAQLQAARLPLLVPLAQALLARLALRAGQPAAAIAYGRQSLAGSRQARLLAGVAEASAVLAEAYDRQRAYGPALAALRQYNAAHDSLTGDNTRRRAALLQYGHERQQQVAQIRLLTQQNLVQAQRRELEQVRAQRTLLGLGGLALLAGGLGGGLFWRYRRLAARRQHDHDAALRARLAADLHDDVGSLLTQISLQSDLLREAPATPEATQARLNRLSDTSRRASRQMADVVWGLHASAAELPEVLAHMRDHAHEVLAATALTVDFAVSEAAAARRPSLATCQTLYLIFKEALHNVVKHARGATHLTVRVSQEGGQLCLRVHDNAPGPAPTARPGGHGLANMRRRAEDAGGSLRVGAGADGFGVVACLPE